MRGHCHRTQWRSLGLHPIRREEQLCCTLCSIKQKKYVGFCCLLLCLKFNVNILAPERGEDRKHCVCTDVGIVGKETQNNFRDIC